MTRFSLVHRDSLSCEAIVRQMPNGELLMVSQCKGPTEPHPDNRVFYWHSKDNGETWDKPTSIWPEDGRAVYQTEVSVIGDEVKVYLTIHEGGFVDWKCTVMRSLDSGYTWENIGEPPCFSEYTFFRGLIEMSDHTLIQPYQYYPVTEAMRMEMKEKNIPIFKAADIVPYNENGVIRSTDGGKTWTSHAAGTLMHDKGVWHWGEPTVCELESGHLVMLVRVNRSGFLWRSDSYDGEESWCNPFQTDIPNPNNKVKLIRLPEKRIALIHTPTNHGMTLTDRHPLELWISDDFMKSWEYKRTLLDFPGAISYPDGFVTQDGRHIRFAIEFNRHDIYYAEHEIEI